MNIYSNNLDFRIAPASLGSGPVVGTTFPIQKVCGIWHRIENNQTKRTSTTQTTEPISIQFTSTRTDVQDTFRNRAVLSGEGLKLTAFDSVRIALGPRRDVAEQTHANTMQFWIPIPLGGKKGDEMCVVLEELPEVQKTRAYRIGTKSPHFRCNLKALSDGDPRVPCEYRISDRENQFAAWVLMNAVLSQNALTNPMTRTELPIEVQSQLAACLEIPVNDFQTIWTGSQARCRNAGISPEDASGVIQERRDYLVRMLQNTENQSPSHIQKRLQFLGYMKGEMQGESLEGHQQEDPS